MDATLEAATSVRRGCALSLPRHVAMATMVVGEAWKTIDLQLDAATFERLQRKSIVYETTVDFRAAGPRVKAVVYDFLGDRVGTAVREIR